MTLSTTRLSALALAALLSACGGDDGKDTDVTDTDTDTSGDTADTGDTNTCTSGVNKVTPDDKAVDVFVRQRFAVQFKGAEKDTASFKIVKDSDSSEIDVTAATWDEAGKSVYFDPAETLEPSTDYTLRITYSCGDFSAAFSTSEVGTALSDEAANGLEGQAFVLDLTTMNVIEPAGVGGLLTGLLGDLDGQTIAIVPDSIDTGASTMTFFGGLVTATIDGGAVSSASQDCEETFAFDQNITFDNPFFEFSGNDLKLNVADFELTLGAVSLSGAYAPDAKSMVGITLAGAIDARDLSAVLGDLVGSDDPSAACDLLVTFGVTCEACSDGEEFCLSLVATDIAAYLAADLDMTAWSATDVENECQTETPVVKI